MSIEIIDLLKPKNGGNFPIVEAIDVWVEGFDNLADAVSHFATDAMIEAINTVLSGKANTSDVNTAVTNLQGQIDQIVISASAEAVVAPEVAAARVGADSISYQTLKARLDAENTTLKDDLSDIGESAGVEKNNFTPIVGKVIMATKTIADDPSFNISDPISVESGNQVVLIATGYSTSISMIASCDENGNILSVLKQSVDSTEREYTYNVVSNGYIRISYKNNKKCSLTVYRNITNSKLDNRISALENNTEVPNARTGNDGTSYNTLKERLDSENTTLNNELKQLGIYSGVERNNFTPVVGKVIMTNGTIADDSSFNISEPIPIKKGEEVSLIATGYSTSVCMIASCDENGDILSLLRPSIDSTEREYTYTSTFDGYIRISYKNNKRCLLTIIRNIINPKLDNRITALESPFETRNISNLGGDFKDHYLYSGQSGEARNDLFTYQTSIPVEKDKTYISNYPMRFIVVYNKSGTQVAYTTTEQSEITPTVDGTMTVTIRLAYKLKFKIYENTYEENKVEFIGQTYYDKPLKLNPTYEHPKLYGKILYNFGDSIAKGEGNNDYGYAEMLRDITGCKLYEYAVGGATIATDSGTSNTVEVQINQAISFITEYAHSRAEIVLLNGGTNDFSYTYPVGSANDNYEGVYDKTTICGGMENCIYKIKEAFPDALIIFVLVHKNRRITTTDNRGNTMTYDQIEQAQKEVCNKWGIPYVDIYNRGMNTRYANNAELYSTDGTHPNELGYRKFYYPQVLSELESIL